MGVEIERRFLVDGRGDKPWRKMEHFEISQYYLSGVIHNDGNIIWKGRILVEDDRDITNITTWRIRYMKMKDGVKGVLTAKGRKVGATATEYEWGLPADLCDSLNFEGLPTITKTRYLWPGNDGLVWEIDEFKGNISGLIIAEVELESEDQDVELPSWVGLELTHLRGWSNASLSRMVKDAEQN